LADGVLRTTSLRELNIPLSVRMKQLSLSVNYYRWLYCLVQNQSVIVVNIPAAYLKVYRDKSAFLEMRIIVGKPSTPTPTLASSVREVILYPYWHVPFSIKTKELLPAIQRNPGYIHAGNYQVLNSSGKILDPYSINWHALSANYFPYIIRQSTGCDNSLGLLKLNFYSPFGVYLHDTPKKNLFGLNKRYFSHGCMRMEKPMDLGHLVLKNNSIAIDTLEEKGCLRNQSPVTVKADENIPVLVWYNPAGIDSTGRVLFFEDVYKKFDWMKRKQN
jgi:murein L,D-transpeptidase YcbB/YkuD